MMSVSTFDSMKRLIITIDGPAGAGKTTVSRALAKRLDYVYVDTGALYRAVALAAQRDQRAIDDEQRLAALFDAMTLEFKDTSHGPALFLNGENVSDLLRSQQITMLASALSAKPIVRQQLLDVQRRLGVSGGAVFEGRDMGTVVFPQAEAKFFLSADPQIRAARRHEEMLAKGVDISFTEVADAMEKRDLDDSGRALAPLKPADDAISVDSTSMGVEAVVELMMSHIEKAWS